EQVDPYLPWGSRRDEVLGELNALQDVRDKGELEKRLRRLVEANEEKSRAAEARLSALGGILSLASRAGEPFAPDLLGKVGPLLDETKDAAEPAVLQAQAALLEQASLLAADYGHKELVKDLAVRSGVWLKKGLAEDRLNLAGGLAGQSLRSLRKLGLREE